MINWNFPICLQLTSYSCGAAVYQMAVRFVTGKRVSHRKAIEAVGCEPDGVSMTALTKALRSAGVRVGKCAKRQVSIRAAIDAGKVVVIDDNNSYNEPHVEIIFGYGRQHYWVADPMRLIPRKRAGKDLIAGSTSLFTVLPLT